MAFCGNCGAQYEDGAKFCSSCGTPAGGAAAPQETQAQQQPGNMFTDTPDTTAQYDPADIEAHKGIGILCYLGILLLIPLLVKPDSKYIKFHANQGLILFLLAIALSVVSVIPILGWLLGLIGGIFCTVCVILGIVNVVSGKAKELPLIGKIKMIS